MNFHKTVLILQDIIIEHQHDHWEKKIEIDIFYNIINDIITYPFKNIII